MTDDQRKKAGWVWKSAVKKNPDQYLKVVELFHSFRDLDKTISPLLWCWWQINRQIEEGYTGLAFAGIWHPAALGSVKMRRWYYEEINQEFILRRKIWPQEASELLKILKRYEADCEWTSDSNFHQITWATGYDARFNELLTAAAFSKSVAETRIRDRAEKFDLGIWLSSDLIDYLGLSRMSANLVSNPSDTTPPKPVLRKNSRRAKGA